MNDMNKNIRKILIEDALGFVSGIMNMAKEQMAKQNIGYGPGQTPPEKAFPSTQQPQAQPKSENDSFWEKMKAMDAEIASSQQRLDAAQKDNISAFTGMTKDVTGTNKPDVIPGAGPAGIGMSQAAKAAEESQIKANAEKYARESEERQRAKASDPSGPTSPLEANKDKIAGAFKQYSGSVTSTLTKPDTTSPDNYRGYTPSPRHDVRDLHSRISGYRDVREHPYIYNKGTTPIQMDNTGNNGRPGAIQVRPSPLGLYDMSPGARNRESFAAIRQEPTQIPQYTSSTVSETKPPESTSSSLSNVQRTARFIGRSTSGRQAIR